MRLAAVIFEASQLPFQGAQFFSFISAEQSEKLLFTELNSAESHTTNIFCYWTVVNLFYPLPENAVKEFSNFIMSNLETPGATELLKITKRIKKSKFWTDFLNLNASLSKDEATMDTFVHFRNKKSS